MRAVAHRGGVRTSAAALRSTAVVGDEHAHAVALAEWARHQVLADPASPLGLLFSVPNGGFRSARTAGRLYAEGLRKGVSDYMLPVPRRDYHGVFLELKRPARNALLSPEQRQWLTEVATWGYLAAVCWGWDAARVCLEWYLAADDGRGVKPFAAARGIDAHLDRAPAGELAIGDAVFDRLNGIVRWQPVEWGRDG